MDLDETRNPLTLYFTRLLPDLPYGEILATHFFDSSGNSDPLYHHADALHSPWNLTNSSGEIVANFDYGPWGKLVSASDRHTFCIRGRNTTMTPVSRISMRVITMRQQLVAA